MKIKKSAWKFPYNLVRLQKYKSSKADENFVTVYNRDLTLTTKFLDKQLRCHKGKVIGKLLINKQHLGYKLGEFFITKILGDRIAYRKKQKLLLKKTKNKQKLLKK
jgi:ribosomal protein S19